ncbi:hypothetical protein [Paenibacillus endoradicis]|uniref:hypothetical protein n=1 Tax=Paenibacillus endoradicis TaxID=2972487 RepID=UPI002158D24E|nr:hypothetical protein [Paenibacillus endoradicis]MCR8656224.1 hypothetical protein [Paenibacillus endoradicis]
MSIGNIKGILGDAVSNDVRTLELKIGQVVRGVVLQQYDNNEALVNINGVQVRAKLDIPLMEGQASLLQVQPDSKGAYILLKQVDPTTLGMNDPMKDILKALNMPDKAWANDIIKDLRKEGFPLNKETAAAFQKAAQLIPPGVNQEQWMQAAASAFKRGLPMTQATISAFHQLQSGAPLHLLIDQLKSQLSTLLQANNSGSTNTSAQTVLMLNQLSTLLDEGSALLRSLATNGATTQNSLSIGAGNQGAIVATGSGELIAKDAPLVSQQGQAQAATQSQSGLSPSTSQGNLGLLLKWLGVNHETTLGKQLLNQPLTSSQPQTNQATTPSIQTPLTTSNLQSGNMNVGQGNAVNSAGALGNTTVPPTGQQPNVGNQVQPATTNAAPTTSNQSANVAPTPTTPAAPTPVTAFQQSVVTSQSAEVTSNQVSSQPVSPSNPQATQPTAPQQISVQQAAHLQGAPQANVQSDIVHNQATVHHNPLSASQQADNLQPQANAAVAQAGQATMNHESLKSSIMQLLQSTDTPAAVKETAQQLLNAITGQQLMLSTERNHSVFSHVTMFIPLQDQDGGQTAAVHIQTRRDRKGELDSENCRIVFDLNMNAIGPTMVDVNITSKIVSLNLWNDHPAISSLIEALKPEISEALYSTGYMLSSVRTTPIPTAEAENEQLEELKQRMLPPDVEQINSTRYKGVDFKV